MVVDIVPGFTRHPLAVDKEKDVLAAKPLEVDAGAKAHLVEHEPGDLLGEKIPNVRDAALGYLAGPHHLGDDGGLHEALGRAGGGNDDPVEVELAHESRVGRWVTNRILQGFPSSNWHGTLRKDFPTRE